jgi:MFS transporter, DHA3 family, multidrug efflux protein
MRTFLHLLANTLVATTTNNFIWFGVTFWVFLETKSVFATSLIAGIFLVNTSLSSIWFGSVVDHRRKKTAMLLSSLVSLVLYGVGLAVYATQPESTFTRTDSVALWGVVLALMAGVTAGNLRSIALSTAVTFLVDAERRDKANGMVGTATGISFAITSVASGLVLGQLGMLWVLIAAVALTLAALVHLLFVRVEEREIAHTDKAGGGVDFRGTLRIIRSITGLLALILFTTFNNFLGGVFMALMDAYGLSLVSVEVWGLLWGGLSLGFIIGGLYVAKFGLGINPLRGLFRANIAMWIVCIFFTIQPSIWLLAVGCLVWMALIPFVEATEQTIIQKVVPFERQGRVFGVAQSIEQAASPVSAFAIGPLAQFVFIPFMTSGAGVELIGDWFGVGPGRGIALVFVVAGIAGLIVTLIAMRSSAYRRLAEQFRESGASEVGVKHASPH